jgi:serine/threonine protein kinase
VSTSPVTIGRYQVVRTLGVGGMGAVYLARDPDLDRALAIKLVKDGLSGEPELLERFMREAKSAAKLRHPNIITVFDIGEHEGRPFIAMEFIPGESLSDIIKREPRLNPGWVLRWMEGLCQGLAHAHSAGVVHRDIKPANLMIDKDGNLKIVDFGIARAGESQLTRSGVLIGTTNYMSPEQVLGAPTDHRSDIFAVGAVFYELLTGKRAFPGTVPDGLFDRICNDPPELLTTLCPGIDPSVPRVVDGALHKDPSRRYQDLAAMAADIGRVRSGEPAIGPVLPQADDDGATLIQTTVATVWEVAVPAAPMARSFSQATTPAPSFRSASPSTTPATSPRSTSPTGAGTGGRSQNGDTAARRRRAEVFVDASETAVRAGEFTKAREMLDKAATFDADAAGLPEARASLERAEAQAQETSRRRAGVEADLTEASARLVRGDFAAARALLKKASAAEPDSPRIQALLRRVTEGEKAALQRDAAATANRKRWHTRLWVAGAVVVCVIVSLAAISYFGAR